MMAIEVLLFGDVDILSRIANCSMAMGDLLSSVFCLIIETKETAFGVFVLFY
jgi:hypothetical protein